MEDEHTPQHFFNCYSLSSYMSHNYLKLLTLCPYELIKMLNMFISEYFRVYISNASDDASDFMSTLC